MQRTFQGSFLTGKLGYSVAVAIRDAFRLAASLGQLSRRSVLALANNNVIWCEPGVDAIDARNFTYNPGTPEAAITLQQIIEKRWISFGVAETETVPFRLKDHWGEGWIVYPFILDRPVSFEARFFERWDADFLPNPLQSY
jgi:hypothetical protein